MRPWQVSRFESGRPLIAALALRIPAAPQGYLSQLARKGKIFCQGEALAGDAPVSTGMTLTLPASERLAELFEAGGLPPWALLYEDQAALVVFKPTGLAVHRAAGHDDNLTDRVARFLSLRRAPHSSAPVHRLDIGTSGPVLFGKGRQGTGEYGRLLMDGRIGKSYLALANGTIPEQGELTSPVPEHGVLRPSLARFRRLAQNGTLCLLEVELVTGRPHQVRRQLADAGWPIVGDRRYGGRPWPGLAHPFLHCHRLQFPGLDDGEIRRIDVPLPEPLMTILAAAGLTLPPAFHALQRT